MAKVQPHKMRSQISDGPAGLTVTIPTKKNYLLLIILAVWLFGWAVAEVTVPKEFLRGNTSPLQKLFMAAWIIGWTLGGIIAIFIWLWNVAGKEIIRVTGMGITIKRAVFDYGIERQYDMAYIKNLRLFQGVGSLGNQASGLRFWGFGGGLIAFDYGAKTYRFGSSIDEAEARELVEKILNKARIIITS
ncbi:MAG TPA: hypothetical protein VLX29_05225 [Nitrospirota bacterium]|nr:hypothetical protein [Nitrospirota bacterium]